MEKTKNYKLNKPTLDEQYDLDVINQNTDSIDSQMKKNEDSISDVVKGITPVEKANSLSLGAKMGDYEVLNFYNGQGRFNKYYGDYSPSKPKWAIIKINSKSAYMINFTLGLMDFYNQYKILISGYNYPAYVGWSDFKANGIFCENSKTIKAGYYEKDLLYIAIKIVGYTSISIDNVRINNISLKSDFFKISFVDSEAELPNVEKTIEIPKTTDGTKQMIFDMMNPIEDLSQGIKGKRYLQLPDEDDPNTMFNRDGIVSTWTEITDEYKDYPFLKLRQGTDGEEESLPNHNHNVLYERGRKSDGAGYSDLIGLNKKKQEPTSGVLNIITQAGELVENTVYKDGAKVTPANTGVRLWKRTK